MGILGDGVGFFNKRSSHFHFVCFFWDCVILFLLVVPNADNDKMK